MTDCVFFYGTLLTEFGRCRRAGIDSSLTFVGRGAIKGALFDLGLYPAAVPAEEGVVRGDVYRVADPERVMARLDEIEGAAPPDGQPDAALYTRTVVSVTLDGGGAEDAWVYFYNAPLGQSERIPSGDYRLHMQGKRYP